MADQLSRVLLQGFHSHQIGCDQFLNLRYEGTDVAVMTSCSEASTFAEVRDAPYQQRHLLIPRCLQAGNADLRRMMQAFEQSYRREFGFVLEGRKICVDDMRVRAAGRVRCFHRDID